MNWQFSRPAKREPGAPVVVHLWHRQPDASRITELQDAMLATRQFRNAKLVVHDDGEQAPGAVVIEGDDSWRFDLPTFRLMVNDIL